MTATAGVITPSRASNAAGTTITSVRLTVADGFDDALTFAPPDDAAFVVPDRAGDGFLAVRDRAGVDGADLDAPVGVVAALVVVVPALDAGFADVDAGLAAVAALEAGFAA